MYAAERQQRILSIARADSRVEVNALAEVLGVTAETVRRDLTQLERLGHLRRVHGGAIPIDRFAVEPNVAARSERSVAQKAAIARAALAYIPRAGTILIDAGTTTLRLAEILPHDRELTVVTNSLTIAAAVALMPSIDLYVAGGRIRRLTHAAVGEWAVDALNGFVVDVAFLGTNGLCVRHGLTTPDQAEAGAKQAMVRSARRSVALADSSKVGIDHLCRFADLADLAAVVTDSGLDSDTAAEIEACGPEVIRA